MAQDDHQSPQSLPGKNRAASADLLWKGAILFLGTAAGTFVFLFVMTIWAGEPIRDSLINAHGILVEQDKELSPEEIFQIVHLIEKGRVVPAQDLLSNLSGYYESVITTLAAGLGILGVLAFMYVKVVSAERAEEAAASRAEVAVRNHLKTHEFVSGLHEQARTAAREEVQPEKELVRSYLLDLDDRAAEKVNLRDLMERIAAVEARLSMLDMAEEEGEERTLVGSEELVNGDHPQ